ncbi:MAG TPA: GAF domain-containing SpoIIE family protein phosphatase [Bacteroidota bacterium]|nr:GAF domain-containing SpoIIE family protein phosphatase [Bacteroidota bacterium]
MTGQTTQDPMLRSLEEENKRLKRAVEELSVLNDLARAIGASLNTQEIIQTIVRRSLRASNAEQGVITLVEEESNQSMKTLVRTMVSSTDQGHFHFSQALLGWMHLNKKPLVINDPKNDDRFRGIPWDESVRSLIAVPMMVKSELRGVLTVYNKKEGKPFTEDDQRLLAIIAGQSGQVVENSRLYEQEKTLAKMQEELRFAARIQNELLPKSAPLIPGYEIAGTSIPAQAVGGDYYDFIPIDEHRLAFCLGDVTGKGLPASLLMANLQATLRGQTLTTSSPRTCLERSNQLLYQSTSPEKFATLFYAILDTQNHEIRYSNAGHENPYLRSGHSGVKRLKTGGIPLGMLPEFGFEEESVQLDEDSMLVIYSDGVTEAMNAAEDMFGDEGVAAVLDQHQQASPAEVISALVAAVKKHAAGYPQSDDITVVVVRRKKS